MNLSLRESALSHPDGVERHTVNNSNINFWFIVSLESIRLATQIIVTELTVTELTVTDLTGTECVAKQLLTEGPSNQT